MVVGVDPHPSSRHHTGRRPVGLGVGVAGIRSTHPPAVVPGMRALSQQQQQQPKLTPLPVHASVRRLLLDGLARRVPVGRRRVRVGGGRGGRRCYAVAGLVWRRRRVGRTRTARAGGGGLRVVSPGRVDERGVGRLGPGGGRGEGEVGGGLPGRHLEALGLGRRGGVRRLLLPGVLAGRMT